MVGLCAVRDEKVLFYLVYVCVFASFSRRSVYNGNDMRHSKQLGQIVEMKSTWIISPFYFHSYAYIHTYIWCWMMCGAAAWCALLASSPRAHKWNAFSFNLILWTRVKFCSIYLSSAYINICLPIVYTYIPLILLKKNCFKRIHIKKI